MAWHSITSTFHVLGLHEAHNRRALYFSQFWGKRYGGLKVACNNFMAHGAQHHRKDTGLKVGNWYEKSYQSPQHKWKVLCPFSSLLWKKVSPLLEKKIFLLFWVLLCLLISWLGSFTSLWTSLQSIDRWDLVHFVWPSHAGCCSVFPSIHTQALALSLVCNSTPLTHTCAHCLASLPHRGTVALPISFTHSHYAAHRFWLSSYAKPENFTCLLSC